MSTLVISEEPAVMIKVKRVYEPYEPSDGSRILVERLWPRGVRKNALRLDTWLRDVAPSPALRRWFAHDPKRWAAFRQRYAEELDAQPGAWRPIVEASSHGTVTLLFSARDIEHNNAVALMDYLNAHSHTPGAF
jgi:uncharacterized protein YeaO (DUF488 family)